MRTFILLLMVLNIHGLVAVKDITSQVNFHGEGILAGYGDFNSDKATDLFMISRPQHTSLYVYFWDITKQTFKNGHNLYKTEGDFYIANIALSDFNGDGYMDVLVSAQSKSNKSQVTVYVLFGDKNLVKKGDYTLTMVDQPTLLDVNGDLIPDLFGTDAETKERSYWISEIKDGVTGKHSFSRKPQFPGLTASLYTPTSNGFLDVTGDMHPDLLVMSQPEASKGYLFETWEQRTGQENLTHFKTFTLNTTEVPKHVGQMSFADIDSDSNTELILPVCMTSDCSISMIYVKSMIDDTWQVLVDFTNAEMQLPLKYMDKAETSSFPFALRFNDLTMDGNVDAVAVLQWKKTGALFPAYLVNVKCASEKSSGCQGTRTLQVKPIESGAVSNPVLISLFDVNENGVLDFMITCEDSVGGDEMSKKYKTKILQNDLNFDTAFVKVAVLSGLKSSPSYGSNQVGAIVQISTTNTDGSTMVGQSIQLSQSSYFSLQLPYVIFGLGKSPNFIEQINVGIPKGAQVENRVRTWTAIIPNAQVIVVPYPKDKPYDWVTKLLVTPGKLLLQTGGVLIGTILLIGGIILILHIKEKREDEREKRRDAHKFHFDAL